MKIHVLSDLHLEVLFFGWRFKPARDIDFDVLVLAGDIDNGTWGVPTAEDWYPDKPIIYVPGNHEYYGEEINALDKNFHDYWEGDKLVSILNPGVQKINGTVFIGCTLWTDFQLYGDQQECMAACARALNDYFVIRFADDKGERALKPEDTLAIHHRHKQFLEEQLEKHQGQKVVVITHHLPSERSVQKRYLGDQVTTAFASDLESLIHRYKPALWIHGHSHHSKDYFIGSTRVVSNPRGYPGEHIDFIDDLVVEL